MNLESGDLNRIIYKFIVFFNFILNWGFHEIDLFNRPLHRTKYHQK